MKARGHRELYSLSFRLFRRGEAVDGVARRLGISRGQALSLKHHYLADFSEVTNYYIYENERRRQELVENLLKNLQLNAAKGFKGLDDPEIQMRLRLILRHFPDAVQILLFPPAGNGVAEWERLDY